MKSAEQGGDAMKHAEFEAPLPGPGGTPGSWVSRVCERHKLQ